MEQYWIIIKNDFTNAMMSHIQMNNMDGSVMEALL